MTYYKIIKQKYNSDLPLSIFVRIVGGKTAVEMEYV